MKNKKVKIFIFIVVTILIFTSVHWLLVSYIPYQKYYENMSFNILDMNVYTENDEEYQYNFVPADFLKHNMCFSVEELHTDSSAESIVNLKIHHNREKEESLSVYIILHDIGYDIKIDNNFNYLSNENLTEEENNEYKEIYSKYAQAEVEKKYNAYIDFFGIKHHQ